MKRNMIIVNVTDDTTITLTKGFNPFTGEVNINAKSESGVKFSRTYGFTPHLDEGNKKDNYRLAILEAGYFVEEMTGVLQPVYNMEWFGNIITYIGNMMLPTIYHKIALRAVLNSSVIVKSDTYTGVIYTIEDAPYWKAAYECIPHAKKEVRKNIAYHVNLDNVVSEREYYRDYF